MADKHFKTAATAGVESRPSAPATTSNTEGSDERRDASAFPVVGVGASAGGLDAFTQLLKALPVDTGMGFVLVSHLDPTHASMLAEILSRATTMPVMEVKDEPKVEPNHVYVIPPNRSMVISSSALKLSPLKEVRAPHRSIDHFLRSLAADQGHLAIGVILSGSGNDGTSGLEEIKAAGGITFAQDQTAQHDSMPQSARAAGCVDFVLAPAEIAKEITRIANHPYVAPLAKGKPQEEAVREPNHGRVLELLRQAMGVDFTNYKRNTLSRRIARRMVLNKIDGLNDYVRLLQSSPIELQALYQDILISVTGFFRDSEAFDVLKTSVFPALTENQSRHEPVRMWVLGCSSGEEVYSLAIAFTEFAEASNRQAFQIFATDLNGNGIEKARTGIYSKSIALEVSPERLRRFFVEVDDGYRVDKTIREACVFTRHNVLSEPPFSRIDLISCRNLLIYLEAPLQQKVIPLLHYALKPNGFLWLGNSETIGAYRDLFEIQDVHHKIYSKKPAPVKLPVNFSFGELAATRKGLGAGPGRRSEALVHPTPDAQKEADRIVLSKYGPPGVLVNGDLEILQFRGETGPYLAPAPGKASLNLLKMLREGLLVSVRGAIHKAKREEIAVREEGLHVKSNGGDLTVDVQVIPVKGDSAAAGCLLILFEEMSTSPRHRTAASKSAATSKSPEPEAADQEGARLKQELAATREYLQSVIEQQEAANEELQSANEEVQSTNEELQSINEEMETSKEEIQSSNEELATLNDELQNRNLELNQSNNDMMNLLASVEMAIVMLGSDLRIRRFTPTAEKLLNLIQADVGRPISDIKLKIDIPNIEGLLGEVIETVTAKEFDVQDKNGRWHLLRLRPYRTSENKVDGAVLVLVDVDTLKRNQETLRRQAELLEQVHEPIIVWEFDGTITYWNRAARETYGFTEKEAIGQSIHQLLAPSVDPQVFKAALTRDGHWMGELAHTRRDGQRMVFESRMARVEDAQGHVRVIESNWPITERKRLEEDLRKRVEELAQADQNKNQFLAMLAHELRNPLAPLRNAAEVLKTAGHDSAMRNRVQQMMNRQIQNMSRMVDDLLDVSRLTLSKINLRRQPVDVLKVLEGALDAARPEAEAHGLKIELARPSDPVVIDADPTRLEQIFDNLLNNAVKYTSRGGHIWVTVEVDGRPGEKMGGSTSPPRLGTSEVIVRVRDDGLGIAPSILPHVFDLFIQADHSLARSQGGLGIGLTLVKKLVELHDGRIAAQSAGPGQGSEFTMHLPLQPAPATGAARELAPSLHQAKIAPCRILVVDDSVDAAESLALLLRMEGHEVQAVHDGPATLEATSAFKPQLVLLDIGLPGMDGYEVARTLRRRQGPGKLCLVAVTGYGQDDDRRRTREAGCDHHLTKPIDLDFLHQVLAQAAGGEK